VPRPAGNVRRPPSRDLAATITAFALAFRARSANTSGRFISGHALSTRSPPVLDVGASKSCLRRARRSGRAAPIRSHPSSSSPRTLELEPFYHTSHTTEHHRPEDSTGVRIALILSTFVLMGVLIVSAGKLFYQPFAGGIDVLTISSAIPTPSLVKLTVDCRRRAVFRKYLGVPGWAIGRFRFPGARSSGVHRCHSRCPGVEALPRPHLRTAGLPAWLAAHDIKVSCIGSSSNRVHSPFRSRRDDPSWRRSRRQEIAPSALAPALADVPGA